MPPFRCATVEILRGGNREAELRPGRTIFGSGALYVLMLATAILHACGTTTTAAITGGTGGSSGLPFALGPILTYGIATAILGAGIIVLVTIVALSRRYDPVPAPVPVGATLSLDGYYWWDGAAWRPVR